MRTAHINCTNKELGLGAARALATMLADKDSGIVDPFIVAWRDKKTLRRSPVLEACAVESSWHDYGANHGGALEVDVNGDFEFIFGDAGAFESYGPSPYVNLRDAHGVEYLCQSNALRDPKNPSGEACTAIDEWTSKLT